MLASHAFSSQSSPSVTTKPCFPSNSRSALTDSTNVSPRSDVCRLDHPKSFVYPTSSTRTSCSWSDIEFSTGPSSTPSHSRHHHFSSSPSPFQVTYKAPPTVSISLSAVCSQSILGERSGGLSAQDSEPDLPDVKSVVPFPCTPLDGDMDVEMLDGTCVPCQSDPLPSTGQAPRKRRSAHSSISSSQGIPGKDAKQKRPRISRRQVAELWWLGVVHRSIMRSIEARHSVEINPSDGLLSGPRGLDFMDQLLIEKIRKRLADNGCVEGRPPSPSPRISISSPSISVPSVNRLAPSRKTFPMDLAPLTLLPDSNPKENGTLGRTLTTPSPSKASSCAPLSNVSYPLVPLSTPTSHRRHVRFEIAQRPRQSTPPPSIPRRSPSPPPRTGSIPNNAPSLTLTMPQLVASLTFSYHERSRLSLRGRTCKPTGCGKNAGRSLPSVPCQLIQCNNDDAMQDRERMHHTLILRARLSSAPERKSPLSHVLYAEG